MNKPTPEENLASSLRKAIGFEAKEEAKEEERKRAERALPYHLKKKPGYIVRIELHGIEHRQDYQQLHDYLRGHGFSTTIESDRGADFRLPSATYYFDNPSDHISYREVHNKAALGVQAALEGEYARVKVANENPTILVTKTDLLFWSGLADPDPVVK